MNSRSFIKLNKLAGWFSLLLVIVLAACSPAAAPAIQPTATSAPTVAPTTVPSTGGTPAATEATINVANDPKLGQILVDGKGMTLYIFTKDTPDKSNCSANCLKVWPPLLTQGQPTLGSGVDASMIGNTTLADGSKIVTYNHMPLYLYTPDTKPGDTNGQGVGGVWFVIAPNGQPMKNTGSSSTPSASTPAASSSSSGGSSTSSASSEATINVATDPKLGKILVDGKGMTLYMFGKDTPDKSNCTSGCLKVWPPLLTQGKPTLGSGVDASMVGNTTLADGSKIVTYNHMPLYYYAKDTKPGDTNGQGVGSIWFVVSPDGKPVGQ